MKKKDLILLIFIYLAGIAALFVFITARSSFLFKKVSQSQGLFTVKYGDLYQTARIDDFKILLPAPAEEKNEDLRSGNINESDMIIFGDSFFTTHYGANNFPNQIAEKFNIKPFVYIDIYDDYKYLPFYFLKKHGYKKQEKKILLFESVERSLVTRFDREYNPNPEINEPLGTESGPSKQNVWDDVKKVWFTETDEKYEWFLKNNIVTNKLVDIITTQKFRWFGIIHQRTPVYSLNPPILFYEGPIRQFKEGFGNDEQVEAISEKLLFMQKELLERYNLELVFMPIPNKYTVYYELLTEEKYNDFLPRLHDELDRLKIKNVRVYDAFVSAPKDELLYWNSDTHWNNKGMEISLNLLAEFAEFIDE